MQTFIDDVVQQVWEKHGSVDQIIFVLPSKRAGTFLKNSISKKVGKTIFAPTIYSIEEFIEMISELSYATGTEQLFELYGAYLETNETNKDSFDGFLNWGQTLLQDFNEVDRYLVDAEVLFSNLTAIQEINHWSVKPHKTEMIANYLSFWKHLLPMYSRFNSNLIAKGIGHQGLVYRIASEKLPSYIGKEVKTHVFLGFNALNKAESQIIQTLLDRTPSEIYWDIDPYFLEDPLHDAGLFIRNHKNSWPSLKNRALKGINHEYLATKHMEVIGVPKYVSQAKYVGHLLSHLSQEQPQTLKDTALVLGDESLLSPILNSIPAAVPSVNITMGQKLELTSLAGFFIEYFELHELSHNKGWFFRDFIRFVSHPSCNLLLKHHNIDVNDLLYTIRSKNWTFITTPALASLIDMEIPVVNLLFSKKDNQPRNFLEKCSDLVGLLKQALANEKNNFGLEQLYKFHTLFIQIKNLTNTYDYITSLKTLKNLLKQLLSKETLDFQGDPLEGLQLMGMLESRNIDFEHVIITSVNEGILPSGKSNNSFIPFDLKLAHGLPTYKEKDAVYTYHFYRLLQRAKNVYLFYNTEPDVLEGGERSRLITQLLTDENRTDIIEKIASPQLQSIVTTPVFITKSENLLKDISDYCFAGFSPSSLSNYIRNPIDFYKQNLLGIKETMAVEETIAANTFGTIVHDTLEELYLPFVGKILTKENLLYAKGQLNEVTRRNFQKTYLDGDISTGKNYLSYHVIQKYISNFIASELEQVKSHTIKIIALEYHMKIPLTVSGIPYPIILKGKLDRIDEVDGIVRIIDYKTGKVEKRNVEIKSWHELITDYRYNKAFQLLCYSYMYLKVASPQPMTAGIISLKNLKEGVLNFAEKGPDKTSKQMVIDSEIISKFETALHKLIQEICNPDIPFVEKEL